MPEPEQDVAEPVPTADAWQDEATICMVLRHSSIIEYEGELTPGLGLTAAGAILLAGNLLSAAAKVMQEAEE